MQAEFLIKLNLSKGYDHFKKVNENDGSKMLEKRC